MSEYQPYFVAYANARGMTPDDVLAADRAEYPGGRMAGFIIWISQQWRAFGGHRLDHDGFAAFLSARYGNVQPTLFGGAA